MSNQDTKTIVLLMDEMAKFRADMEDIDKAAVKIGANTSRMIRVVLAILGALSLYLAYLVFSMASYLAVMLTHLDHMYSQFGAMSDDMQMITQSVKNMGGNITHMPFIAKNMSLMSTDLLEIADTTEAINDEMARMESSTGAIGANTGEMAFRFNNLSRAVNHIGYNVNQMGKPFP
jgi:methyl-accepting chemotaxis protein